MLRDGKDENGLWDIIHNGMEYAPYTLVSGSL